jgi:hypothetical protein
MGGSSNDQKQSQNSTTTSSPWGPAQLPLIDIFTDAKKMYDYGVGPQVYPGTTVTPFSQPTMQGLTQGFNMAKQGNPFAQNVQDYATKTMAAGGTNPFMMEAKNNLSPTASGSMMENNPFFQKALDFQSDNIIDRVNMNMSGAGRGGSGDHGRAMTRELTGQRFGAMNDMYNFERGLQMDANKTIAGMGSDAANISANLVGNASNIDALRYNDIDRMFKIGSTIEGKQGEVLNENKQKFDQQNLLPWQHLELYNGMIQPGAGGTATTIGKSNASTSTPFNPMSLLGIPLMAGGK